MTQANHAPNLRFYLYLRTLLPVFRIEKTAFVYQANVVFFVLYNE